MNYSTAIFLINDNVRAIATIYDPGEEKGPGRKRKVFKTFDKSIAVGDFVVPTDTRLRMTVAKVMEVDVVPEIEASVEMHWIVAKVDRSAYEGVLADEGRYVAMIRDAEKTDQRNKLREKMLAHVDQTALDKLRITQMKSVAEAPRAEPPVAGWKDPTSTNPEDDEPAF